jgi:hypothetical protein
VIHRGCLGVSGCQGMVSHGILTFDRVILDGHNTGMVVETHA